MNGATKLTLLAALMSTAVAQADLTLVGNLSNEVTDNNRFKAENIDTDKWVMDDASTSWSLIDGELVHTGTDTLGAYLMNSISSTDPTLTMVTVSFDYSVAAGSTLYFQSSLLADANEVALVGQLSGDEGEWRTGFYENSYATIVTLDGGADATGKIDQALATIVGGTTGVTNRFSQTFSLADGKSIADYENILAMFGVDAAGGAVSVDNLTITAIPEPASMGLLGLGGVVICMLRRKKNA